MGSCIILVALGLAYALTKEDAFAREVRNRILDFVAQNQPRFGVDGSRPMDVAIRAANWAIACKAPSAAGFRFAGAF